MLSLVSYQTFKSIKNTSYKNTKTNKNIVHDLDYESIKFPVSRKDFGKIEKIIFALMCYVMKLNLYILFKYQMKNLKTAWIY